VTFLTKINQSYLSARKFSRKLFANYTPISIHTQYSTMSNSNDNHTNSTTSIDSKDCDIPQVETIAAEAYRFRGKAVSEA
jgi:hypothetical protein